MQLSRQMPIHRRPRAYTLPEVVIAILLLSIAGVSLYAGFSAGFTVVQNTRENLRATQVMMQWMESCRLYTWTQIQTNSYWTPKYIEAYDPSNPTNKGTIFVGVNTRDFATEFPSEYSTNLRVLTVTVYWTNYVGNKPMTHSRQMQTLYARNGLQNYVLSTNK